MKYFSQFFVILFLIYVQSIFAQPAIPAEKMSKFKHFVPGKQKHPEISKYFDHQLKKHSPPLVTDEFGDSDFSEDMTDSKYYGVVYRSLDGGLSWQAITPETPEWEYSYLYDLEIDANGDILVTGNGGFYKTDPTNINWINYGNIWRVYSILSDQINPNNIWIGTGNELYETNDGGQNWSPLGLVNTNPYYYLYDLVAKSTSPVDILCSTWNNGVINYNNGNWVVGNGPYGGRINKLVMNPVNSNYLFALTPEHGLFQTTDGASSWNYLDYIGNYYFTDLAFAPSNSSIIYLLGDYYLSYSLDGGINWTATNLENYYPGWYNNRIIVHPNDPATILLSGFFYDTLGTTQSRIIKSSDYGQTWTEIYKLPTTNYYWNNYFANLMVDPFNNDHVIAGGYYYDDSLAIDINFLVESYDWGISWNEITLPLPNINQLISFNYSPHQPHTVLAGFDNGELYKSQDNGLNWQLISSGTVGTFIKWDVVDLNTLFMGSWASGIFKSTDAGYSWTWINLEDQHASWASSLVQDPLTPDIIYTSSTWGYGAFKSYDRGDTWSPAVSGLYNVKIWLNGLAQDPWNSNTLYAATYGNGLFRSQNGGASWDKLPESPGSYYQYYGIEVSEFNNNFIYACNNRHYYKSMDYGQSWNSYYFDSNVYGGSVHPYDIETHASLPNYVFMAGRFYDYSVSKNFPALFMSTGNDSVWQITYMDSTTDNAAIYDLEIDPQNPSVLYACGYYSKEYVPPPADVAYIYQSDSTKARSFKTLLQNYGYSTTLIEVYDVESVNFDNYNLIIAGSESGYGGSWGYYGAVANIQNSNKSVLGLGFGGASLFEEMGLSINWSNGYIVSDTTSSSSKCKSIFCMDTSLQIFKSPNPIPIPGNFQIQLYNYSGLISEYGLQLPSGVLLVGREPFDPDYFTIVSENDKYWLWGFTNSPSSMTQTGKELLINIVQSLIDLATPIENNRIEKTTSFAPVSCNWKHCCRRGCVATQRSASHPDD